MSQVDALFARVRRGDVEAFAEWMGSVELPIRLSLRHYARAVDVESIVQETLMRMWILARDGRREFSGENASLRFALGMARNLARAEARRLGREVHLPAGEEQEIVTEPDPPPDPALRRAILDCIAELAGRPHRALMARMAAAGLIPDRDLARRAGMTLNTFLQNIVRARRQVRGCLEGKGIRLREVLS